MKELKLLTEWAEKVTEAPVAARSNRMGTPMSAKSDRPLPRNIDIQYKAQRAHPDLSPEQALSLYMSDELVDKEKMDLAQNKLINRVKGENEKLTRTVADLGKELQDFEQQSQQTDQEVERLKALSAKLKPAGELTKQVAQATTQQIEKMMKEVESLQSKPGMTPEKQKELEQKINNMKTGGLSTEEVKNIHNTIEFLTTKQEIDDQMFDKVMGQLEKTQVELMKKEKRFEKSISRNAQKIGSWGNSFKELDAKVKEIEQAASDADEKYKQVQQTAAEIQQKLEQADLEADEKLSRIMQLIRPQTATSPVSRVAQQFVRGKDEEEVQQAMTDPSYVSGEEFTASKGDAANDSTPDDKTIDMYDNPDSPDNQQDIQQQRNKVVDLIRAKRNQGGRMNEQIEMIEPSGNPVVSDLIQMYDRMFPKDIPTYGEGALRNLINRSYRSLEIWEDPETGDIPLYYIERYLNKVRPALLNSPPLQRDLFKNSSVTESMVKDFEVNLSKLTGGY